MNDKSEILVVLDLDETLVYATKNSLDIEYDFTLGEYFVYKRSHLEKFINYIDKNFRFAIWSSAADSYVDEMTKKLKINERAVFCWARSKATFKRTSIIDADDNLNTEYINEHFFVKRLKKVKKLGFDLKKVLIIDDTPRKSQENYGNAIYIKEFNGDQDDNELLKLSEYLTTLKRVNNVRVVEKRNWQEKMKY